GDDGARSGLPEDPQALVPTRSALSVAGAGDGPVDGSIDVNDSTVLAAVEAVYTGADTGAGGVSDAVRTPSAHIVVLDAPAPPPLRAAVLKVLQWFGFDPAGDPYAPRNVVGTLLWGLYRRVESLLGDSAPTVGVPSVVSTEVIPTGQVVVNGDLGVTDPD